MKKMYLLISLLVTSMSFAQQGSSILFDSTHFGIRSFHTFDIEGTNQKLVYLQQGTVQNNSQISGGNFLVLNNDRLSWGNAEFLNSLCCAAQNECYPVDYLAVAKTDPNVVLFNGLFECTSPLSSGDYTKISMNGGMTSSELPFKGTDTIQQCRGFDISKTNSQVMYMAHNYFNNVFYEQPRIFKSTDGGLNWFVTDTLQGMKPISPNVGPGFGFLKSMTWNDNVVFTSTYDHLAYSTTGGYDFQVRTDLPPFKMIVFDEGDLWIHAVSYDNKIYCNNGGITNNWLPLSNPFNITCIEIDPEDHTIWYAGSDNSGVWKSVNAGLTFSTYNNSFTPSKKVIGISKDVGSGDTIIVATDKRVYKVWEGLLVNVESEETLNPESFSLSQNFPNPFNPVTVIRYSIPSDVKGMSSNVKLNVFDNIGKHVAALVNEKQSAGSYEVNFKAEGLPSGVYFYKLEAGEFVETKRMILLK